MSQIFAGIEGGGTKFVLAVGRANGEILAEGRIPTTTPQETLSRSVDFFEAQQREFGPIAAIGVASFGPLDIGTTGICWQRKKRTRRSSWNN